MANLGKEEDIDLALVPIGDCFTMGPTDALKAISMIQPQQVIPIHYNTFPLIRVSDEDLVQWSRQVDQLGATAHIMGSGATLSI